MLANMEKCAVSVNPLDRVMKIVKRKKDLEVRTTKDRLAQRVGRALVRFYKGKSASMWGPSRHDASGCMGGTGGGGTVKGKTKGKIKGEAKGGASHEQEIGHERWRSFSRG